MGAKRGEVYVCECGCQVEVVKDCPCTESKKKDACGCGCGCDEKKPETCDFECCGEPMKKEVEKTADAKTEKHVPVIEKIAGGYLVKVGSVAHPMVEDHWIEWIELQVGSKVYREYLKPGQKPEAVFLVEGANPVAREHCNKHGLWKG